MGKDNLFKRFFYPSIYLMNHLKITNKIGFVVLVSTIPLLIFFHNLFADINTKIEHAKYEQRVARYTGQLLNIVQVIQEHRGLVNGHLNGNTSFLDRIILKQKEMNSALDEFDMMDMSQGHSMINADDWGELINTWRVLKTGFINMSPEDSFRLHTDLISGVFGTLSHMVDNEPLTVSHEHLRDVIMQWLPYSLEHLGQLRGIGTGIAASSRISEQQRGRLIEIAHQSEHDIVRVRINLQRALDSPSILINPSLSADSDKFYEAFTYSHEILHDRLLNAEKISMDPVEYFDLFTMTIDKGFILSNSVIKSLQLILENRVSKLQRDHLYFMIWTLGILFIIGFILIGSYYSLMNGVSQLIHASRRIAKGDLRVNILPQTKDELSFIAESFNEMALELNRSQESLKEKNLSLERMAEEAQFANKAKSEFLANMSHEIRTPMNGILGMSELLMETTLTAEQSDYTDTIYTSGKSLLAIINDILDFSKIEAGKLKLIEEEFSVRDTVDDVYNILRLWASDKGIELMFNVADSVPANLRGDQLRLRQVLVNLLSNAIKFTPKGSVRLSVKADTEKQGMVRLSFIVEDTGIGISDDLLEKIFESFSQAELATTRKFGGTGLGLSISSRLVKMMGGKINVKSEPGKGSMFYFSIYLKVSKGYRINKGLKPEVPTVQINKCLHILLVEDNLINQKLAVRILEKVGHKIHVANNGRDGVRDFESNSFDLILMDVQMPEMDGMQATEAIRNLESKMKSRTPIIAMTAHAMPEDKEKCINAGMDDYLSKPINIKELMSILEKQYIRNNQIK